MSSGPGRCCDSVYVRPWSVRVKNGREQFERGPCIARYRVGAEQSAGASLGDDGCCATYAKFARSMRGLKAQRL